MVKCVVPGHLYDSNDNEKANPEENPRNKWRLNVQHCLVATALSEVMLWIRLCYFNHRSCEFSGEPYLLIHKMASVLFIKDKQNNSSEPYLVSGVAKRLTHFSKNFPTLFIHNCFCEGDLYPPTWSPRVSASADALSVSWKYPYSLWVSVLWDTI